jgi:hypothetical protein
VQILTNGEGGEVEIEKDLYANQLINSSSLIKLGSETCKVENIIFDVELVELLTGVQLNKGWDENLMGIDSSKIKKTQDYNKKNREKQTKKQEEDILKKLKDSMKNIFDNVVEISEINNCESDDIIQTLDMIEFKGYSEEVVFEVGVDCQTVKKVITKGGISRKLLNTIISSYNHQEVVLF